MGPGETSHLVTIWKSIHLPRVSVAKRPYKPVLMVLFTGAGSLDIRQSGPPSASLYQGTAGCCMCEPSSGQCYAGARSQVFVLMEMLASNRVKDAEISGKQLPLPCSGAVLEVKGLHG